MHPHHTREWSQTLGMLQLPVIQVNGRRKSIRPLELNSGQKDSRVKGWKEQSAIYARSTLDERKTDSAPPIGSFQSTCLISHWTEKYEETKLLRLLRRSREEGLRRQHSFAAAVTPKGRRKRAGRQQFTRVTREGRGPGSKQLD